MIQNLMEMRPLAIHYDCLLKRLQRYLLIPFVKETAIATALSLRPKKLPNA